MVSRQVQQQERENNVSPTITKPKCLAGDSNIIDKPQDTRVKIFKDKRNPTRHLTYISRWGPVINCPPVVRVALLLTCWCNHSKEQAP